MIWVFDILLKKNVCDINKYMWIYKKLYMPMDFRSIKYKWFSPPSKLFMIFSATKQKLKIYKIICKTRNIRTKSRFRFQAQNSHREWFIKRWRDKIQKRNGEITIGENELCWRTEGCDLLARTDELPSKAQVSESELRMPKLAELSVAEPRNSFLLYQPWILCVWERERDILKSLKRRENLLYSVGYAGSFSR